MTKRRIVPILFTVSLLTACGDEAVPVDEDVRCSSSETCPSGEVCRSGFCAQAPECEVLSDCGEGESCTENVCGWDPDVCLSDNDCDENLICDVGECRAGCRNDNQCADTDRCTSDLVCERKPCTELACDEGYDCVEDTGLCELRPCNGGCEEPLECRESDDQCVECFDVDDCGTSQTCTDDGFCLEDSCEVQADCEEGTFCINEFCEAPPECEDDSFEDNDEYDDGGLLAEGEYSGVVSCPYDDDFFKVVADANHSLTVTVDFLHEDGNVELEIFNTVGVLFARRISDDDNESITVNIGTTGVYTIRIWQDAGTQGVDYTLTMETGQPVEVAADLCVVDAFEPNDDVESATEIFSGRWTGMSICEDDSDYYDIPAEPGEIIEVCVTPSEEYDKTLGLEVLAEGEGVILSAAGRTQFCVDEDLSLGTAFYAHVFSTADGDETPYHIRFDVRPGCRIYDDAYDQAGTHDRMPRDGEDPLVPLEEVPAELRVCPGDSDYWPVDLKWRDQLSASITFVHDDGDLQLKLHRPNGSARLGSSGRTDAEVIEYQAEETGTYFLRAYGEGDAMGPYTIDYLVTPYCQEDEHEEHDDADSAAALALGDHVDLWRCGADTDYYEFNVPADSDGDLTVGISFEASQGVLSLSVAAPGGELVDAVGSGGEWSVEFAAETVVTGDTDFYTIVVDGADDVENTYDLSIALSGE